MSDVVTIRQYQPVWRCIYCGDDTSPRKLQKEHIVPLSLGGKSVLPKASCEKCAEKTKEFETYCARNIYGKFRIKHDLPTRHPEQRPEELPLEIEFPGYTEQRYLPVSDYPDVPIPMPIFPLAGIERGVKRSNNFGKVVLKVLSPKYPARSGDYQKIRPPESVAFWQKVEFKFFDFARLLAKIAHSYAIAESGLDAFTPLLPSLILGEDDTLPYFVGSTPADVSDALNLKSNKNSKLHLFTRQIRGSTYLCVIVHLWPELTFPPYQVVTGEVDQTQARMLRTPSPSK